MDALAHGLLSFARMPHGAPSPWRLWRVGDVLWGDFSHALAASAFDRTAKEMQSCRCAGEVVGL